MMRSDRSWRVLAALNGLMAVAAGAFAAHAVSDLHTRDLLHTGAQYQLAHAVAALAGAGLGGRARLAPALFGMGGLVFGASLYLLAWTGVRWIGAITPIGGLMLLAGWAVLIWTALKSPD